MKLPMHISQKLDHFLKSKKRVGGPGSVREQDASGHCVFFFFLLLFLNLFLCHNSNRVSGRQQQTDKYLLTLFFEGE